MPDGATFTMSSPATTTTSVSQFSMNLGSFITAGGPASCGACGCNATVNGFFAGASADRIGTSYHIQDSTGRNVMGAAAYSK